MQDDTRKEWLELCAEAAVCEDSERLGELTEKINEILRAERQRLDSLLLRNTRIAS